MPREQTRGLGAAADLTGPRLPAAAPGPGSGHAEHRSCSGRPPLTDAELVLSLLKTRGWQHGDP